MEKMIKPVRIVLIILPLLFILSIYVVALYDLQVIEGAHWYEYTQNNQETTSTVEASRGSILDRNGKLLVSNRSINNVTFNWTRLIEAENTNGVLLRLVRAAEALEYPHIDSLAITASAPFDFIDGVSPPFASPDESSGTTEKTKQKYIRAYIEYYELDENASAVELMAHMRETFQVDPNYTAEEARIVVGLRFEIALRYIIVSLSPYVFAEDVGADLIAVIGEQDFPGIEITESTVRQYHTAYAAHILGTVGLMNAVEYEDTYKNAGYPMNAYVGKDGIEKVYETVLHGVNGIQTVTRNASGSVIDVLTTKPTEPGDNIVLTLDIDLQETAENALRTGIAEINAGRTQGQERADAGAAVVLDVNSGGVLAMANYPTFNLETYSKDYEALLEMNPSALTNRAATGLYQPGSTFKMVTALAALSTGKATAQTSFTCTGVYSIGEYSYKCLGTHGTVDMVSAIEHSCNVYFYNLAYELLGSDLIAEYAALLGLGSATGLELAEANGHIASQAYKERLYEDGLEDSATWYSGQTLQSAIGQSYHQFTPIQLASYISIIANGGTRYETHLLKEVLSYDLSQVTETRQPVVLDTLPISAADFGTVQEGMRSVALYGTASTALAGLEVSAAAKTGTAETNNTMDDGIFVCYAPYENPEIAVVVIVEKGESGANAGRIARDILEAYFQTGAVSDDIQAENSLLP